MQRAYWMGQRFIQVALSDSSLESEEPFYSPHVYFEYDIGGNFDTDVMEKTMNFLIKRHALLRAVVDEDGQMRVLEKPPQWKVTLDTRSRENIRYEMTRNGPTTNKFPIFDVCFSESEIPNEGMRAHISISLFIMDGRTERILRDEIAKVYYGFSMGMQKVNLPHIGVTFRDYAESVVQVRSRSEYQNAKDYWKMRLPSLPSPPDLPLLDPDVVSLSVKHSGGVLSAHRWKSLKDSAALFGTTTTSLLCSIYALALGRLAAVQTFLLNVMHTLRHDVHPDINKVVGNFSSTILLAVDVGGEHSFLEILKSISKRLASDLDNSIVSGVEIMRDINKSRGSAFQAVAPYAFTSTLGMDAGLKASIQVEAVLFLCNKSTAVFKLHRRGLITRSKKMKRLES